MSKAHGGWAFLLVAILLLASIAAKGLLIQPRTMDASAFDAPRAIARLAGILGDQRPHPVDSPANDAVRARLMAALTDIGLSPELREATDCSGFPKSRTVSCSHVRNVIAIIPGDPAKKALLLSAHYDSTPTGPGAADDGIGVATLLEVGSVLAREPRQRPIILLFNEGEEFGLNGAAVFAERDPLANRVGQLINVDSRGVSGPAIMFETSQPNAAAIDAFADAPAPYANSLSADFARLIPNTTDVVKYRPRGWTILNFANTGNETRYHSPGDDIAHLDPASVAHMGEQVLASARRMAGPDRAVAARPWLYTDVAGLMLFRLPLAAGAVGLGGLVVIGLVLIQRRRAWTSLGRLAVVLLATILVAAALGWSVSQLRAGDYWRATPWVPTLAVGASVLAALGWGVARAADRADRSQLRLAAWTLVLLVGAAISVAMPGAIIFFLVAPALGLLGMKWRAFAWIGGLVQLVMLGELVALIELTLVDGPTFAVAPLVALIALPLLVEVGRSARWPMAAMAVVAVGLWIACLSVPRASTGRPQAMTIDHVQDERRGTARWAIASKQARLPAAFDRFGPWRAGPLPYNRRYRWQADAPLMEGARGGVVKLGEKVVGGRRLVRLRLDRAGADAIALRFDERTPVVAMGLTGHVRSIDPKAAKDPFFLRCSGRSCDGMSVDLLFGDKRPVVAMLVATRFKPPPEASPLIAARPRDAQPQYAPDSQVRVRAVRM